MAGTAAKSILIICSQLHVMNQFSHCHKKTQMKPRWPNSDARNGVNSMILRGCRFRAKPAQGRLNSLNVLNGRSLNLMDGIFQSMNFKKNQNKKTQPKNPTPNPKQLISHMPKHNER